MKWILKPYYLVILTAFISFCVWLIPFDSSFRTGYQIKATLTSESVFILVLWYLSITIVSFLGYKVGRKIKKNKLLNHIPDNYFYQMVSILAGIGVVYTIIYLILIDPFIFLNVLKGSANEIKKALYENYSMGLLSLRYVVAISGSIAIANIIIFKKLKSIDVLNVLMLLLIAAISARLLIIMSSLLVLGILSKKKVVIKTRFIIPGIVILFLLLSFYNNSRNINFYTDRYNINSPFMANIMEIVTYIGSPFQASVGIANNIAVFTEWSNISNIMTVIPVLDFAYDKKLDYRSYVDIESSLTTNSAFVELFSVMGIYSFIVIILTSFLNSIIMGHFSRYKSYIFLIEFVLLYCFAEIWRIYLFKEGIILTLLCAIVISSIIPIVSFKRKTNRKWDIMK